MPTYGMGCGVAMTLYAELYTELINCFPTIIKLYHRPRGSAPAASVSSVLPFILNSLSLDAFHYKSCFCPGASSQQEDTKTKGNATTLPTTLTIAVTQSQPQLR